MGYRGRGGGQASPPYPHKHSGPVFVCGNAWCLHKDLARARDTFGDCPVIAVNGAANEVKAFALFSFHPERFMARGYDWIGRQQRRFGRGFTVHGSRHMPICHWVDHWWEGARGGGSSAWGARKMAKLMGFGPVVLVGCPLSPGGYAGPWLPDLMGDVEVTERYAKEIEAGDEWHEGAVSMSGRTAEILGSP